MTVPVTLNFILLPELLTVSGQHASVQDILSLAIWGQTMTAAKSAIRPEHLARPSVKLPASEGRYDHRTQTGSDKASVIAAITYNATQTFNSKGQPSDKDNDK